MGFTARLAHIKRLSIFATLLLLAGCINDDNSFRSLDLAATATLDGPTVTEKVKVMVVGDAASPKLADQLEVRGYEVTDVPYVAYEASAHAMAGDYIVWTDKRNGTFDIYGYQISTATEFAVSLAAGSQLTPQIAGDYVVWEDYRNGNADIYAYQFSTATEFAVTTADRQQRYPQIDGDYIVWQDERNNESDIYYYQISTATETAVSTLLGDGAQRSPQIKGDHIVWESHQGGYSDIYGYRIAAKQQFVINADNGSQDAPALSEKYVVWVDNSSGNDHLYAYNLGTTNTQQVSNSAGRQQLRPRVSGEYVVWQDFRNGTDFDIYAYSFASDSGITVSAQIGAQKLYPVIEGDYIAWQDYRNGNYDIYAYKISTAQEIQVSSHSTPQTWPLLADGQLAWLDGRRGLVDVMFRQQVEASDQLATVDWVTPAGAIDNIADQKLVIFGSDVFSDEVVLNVFDAALAAKVNVYGLGGVGTSLAKTLATAGRYGLSVTSADGLSPMRLVGHGTVEYIHPMFTDVDIREILVLESDDAVTMDELAIEIDANNAASPLDWNKLASFTTRMANAGKPAIVEFSDESGSKIILDGAAGVADEYTYWSNTRWSMFASAVSYLTSAE